VHRGSLRGSDREQAGDEDGTNNHRRGRQIPSLWKAAEPAGEGKRRQHQQDDRGEANRGVELPVPRGGRMRLGTTIRDR
jgi:hypothetical protein